MLHMALRRAREAKHGPHQDGLGLRFVHFVILGHGGSPQGFVLHVHDQIGRQDVEFVCNLDHDGHYGYGIGLVKLDGSIGRSSFPSLPCQR